MFGEGVRGIRVWLMGGLKYLLIFELEDVMKIMMEDYVDWLE